MTISWFRVNPLLFSCILQLLFLITAPGIALGTVYVVCPDGSGDYPTIQVAVDNAVAGDIIELTDGVFSGYGNRDIYIWGDPITICSQSGNAEACVIDVEGEFNGVSQRGFILEFGAGPETILRDISIINAVADGP